MARRPVSRNLWYIAKEFKVLPTDERFQDLTDEQYGWIMKNMQIDADIERRRAKGQDPNEAFQDYDEEWFGAKESEFEPLKDSHDEEEIAKQVDELTNAEYLQKVRAKFDNEEEWLEYVKSSREGKLAHDEQLVKEKLEEAYEEARRREKGIKPTKEDKPQVTQESVSNESIKNALDLFNSGEEEEITQKEDEPFINEDDIWF